MKICAVNFADGGNYPKAQERLRTALQNVGFSGDFKAFRTYGELPGCPQHCVVPYAFKTFMVEKAMNDGYDIVFCFDSSVVPLKPVETLIPLLESEGHYFDGAAHMVGTWCKDEALGTLDITREESFSLRMLIAGCFGLNLKFDRSREFVHRWKALACDGITFPGAWHRCPSVSSDPRVAGHRHDMTAASVLAHKLSMKILPDYTHVVYDVAPKTESTIFNLVGP